MKASTKTTTKAVLSDIEKEALNNIIPSMTDGEALLNKDVVRYIEIKNEEKALKEEKAATKPAVFAELSREISDIKASGLSTKVSYKRALDKLKAKYKANRTLNAELGLITYMLNLGVSLNKIEANTKELNKWRRDKLTLVEIIKIAK